MGIVEIIWDCSYWAQSQVEESTGSTFFKQYFLCPTPDKATAHRNHIHFSFTRAGAAGKTSFWKKPAAAAASASKSCGTVGPLINEAPYKVRVTPASISCTTARGVLNGFRRWQEKALQSGKQVPARGVLIKTYRCRTRRPQVGGGYVTQKWICTKGSRSIVGTSTYLYTD
jgi:hypothetical protein